VLTAARWPRRRAPSTGSSGRRSADHPADHQAHRRGAEQSSGSRGGARWRTRCHCVQRPG
jgi:hypothetical protein